MNTTDNTTLIAQYLKLEITETARDYLNDEPHTFNLIEETFKDMEELKTFLIDRYGNLPSGRRKIYIDTSDDAQEVGFLHSFWNKDWSHNSKSWYQTDWISITDEKETPRLMRA